MALRIRRRAVVIVAVGLTIAGVILIRKIRTEKVSQLTGAVIADDKDPHKQRPIRNAIVKAEFEDTSAEAVSESTGLFRIQLDSGVPKGEAIRIRVLHPDYHSFVTTTPAERQLHVIRLAPSAPQIELPAPATVVKLANIRVRYATNITSTTTIGTVVRTFDIANTGNVPCRGNKPCSPDGRWKASIDSLSLDTGEDDKHFRNVRVSCLAGPCPFSSIESDRFSRGGRQISAAVRNWSDRVTYLLEAEVAHTMASEMIRYTYPATVGRLMTFTLPATATGASIDTEMDGAQIVFPLGPELRLTWASCGASGGSAGTTIYRCQLEPGYVFNSEPAPANPQ